MTRTEQAQALLQYAKDHYGEGGWDVLYECWSVEDVAESLEKWCEGPTLEDAVANFEDVVSVWRDREQDAING